MSDQELQVVRLQAEVAVLRNRLANIQAGTREDLIDQAVVEAARRYMAAFLAWERNRDGHGSMVLETERDAALQDLRDALTSQSRVRERSCTAL